MNAAVAPASAGELVRRLFVLLKAAAVYGPANEGYRSHSGVAREALAELLSSGGPARLESREDRLYLNGRAILLPAGEAGVRYLVSELRRSGAGGLEFRAGAPTELDAFVFAFISGARRNRTLAETENLLKEAGVFAVVPLPTAGEEEAPSSRAAAAEEPASAARRAFFEAVEMIEDVMQRVRAGQEADLAAAKAAAENLASQVAADPQALFELSILQRFDEYTYAHCVNVSVYSIAIGERLGLRPERVSELGFGALFHDIGKAKLPRSLIDKPDELDEDDWRLMRRHPALGARTLLSMHRTLDARLARAASIAFEHHLGLDGSGYPELDPPRPQELFSRICAIADAFDAMTSGRVYAKRAMAPDEALRRMVQRSGSSFDPLLLRIFIGTAGIFPIGTAVLLDSGERAVVRRNDAADLLRPEVIVVKDGAPARAGRMSVRAAIDPEEHGIDPRRVLREHAGRTRA